MIEIIFSIFSFITYLVNWIRKDLGLWLGVVEAFLLMIGQIIKAMAGFVAVTPSRKDDALVNWIERHWEDKVIKVFKKIKTALYAIK